MKIILFQPEIPQNTGNIIRTCQATNSELILIPPLGFSLSNRQMKRSGLDYFDKFSIKQEENLEAFLEKTKNSFYFFSSKATKVYTKVKYTSDSILIFGSETKGLPKHFFEKEKEKFITIPTSSKVRCLNLSNSVAIGLYEGLRQQNFSL